MQIEFHAPLLEELIYKEETNINSHLEYIDKLDARYRANVHWWEDEYRNKTSISDIRERSFVRRVFRDYR